MVDIFQLFEDMENEALAESLKLQKAKQTEENQTAEYSEEPEVIPQVSSDSNLTKDSQGSLNTSQESGEANELQQESVQTD